MVRHTHQLTAVYAPRRDRQLGSVLHQSRHRRLPLWWTCWAEARREPFPLSLDLLISGEHEC